MKKQNKKQTLALVFRMLRDARPIAHYILLVSILSLLSIFLAARTPEYVGAMCDRLFALANGEAIDKNAFIKEGVLLVLFYVLSALIAYISTRTMNQVVTNHYTCRIRIEMSEKISRIPVKTIDSTPNGDIIARMTNDVGNMGGSIHDLFNIFIDGVLKIIVIAVVIFIKNPILALVTSCFVPLSVFLAVRLASKSEKHFDRGRETGGQIYSKVEENLTGFDTVKAYHLEDTEAMRYDTLMEKYRQQFAQGYLVSGTVQPLVTLVNSISYIAICLVGGLLSLNGQISVGALLSFILYTRYFSAPLETIAYGMSMMQSTLASAKRVYEFLDSEEMETNATLHRDALPRGEVVFEDVSFSYSEDKPLISHLNLTVHPGQKVAIVGPTGGGKTTLVNLLMRFYDPQSGRILVDGKDILQMPREEVHEMFGMVLQDTVLFSATVLENIAYGNPQASEEEIMHAAKCAHIDTFIHTLRDGYHTQLNEESTNISAGQKQLLTIARAYLCDRPILILDEATSNVDTRTELLIQETMDNLMRERTSFVIAHRLSTIENADVILVVDNGQVVERGTHEELLSLGGLYYEIYSSQYSAQS